MSTMTMADVRARFEARFPELQSKAKHYFADYRPEAKDEAVANSLFLAWRNIASLVEAGKANDRLLTSAFCFACRATRSGRVLRAVTGAKSRELWVHARRTGHAISTGIDLDAYVSGRDSVPDIVAFRIDTREWLDSLTENQRRRALDLSEGHATSDLARRWHVSPAAVSLYRRQLNESYRRFIDR